MADILIKDTFFPLRCEDYNFCEDIGGFGCSVNHLVIIRRHGQEKPSWCPLVEVPTHGELVDRDKLLVLMSDEIIQRGGDERSLGIAWAQSAVEVAPSVIEASEGGERDGKL